MNTEQIALALASFGREVVGRGGGGSAIFPRNALVDRLDG